MNLHQFREGDGRFVRQYRYDDSTVVVADFGSRDDLSVDLLEDTALVVSADDDVHYEIDLPSGDPRAFIKNGVLTIEVED